MSTFIHDFEVSLIQVAPKISAIDAQVRAEIEYSQDGDWQIISVLVEAYRRLSIAEHQAKVSPWTFISAPEPIEAIIRQRLEADEKGEVQEAVREQIEEDRVCAADDAADHRRDMMMEDR